MSAYHQLGHDSWNLVNEPLLEGFGGLILSPVNNTPAEVKDRLGRTKHRERLEVILDPQLYKPSSDRGQLAQWAHFSEEVDTVDQSDLAWWRGKCDALLEQASELNVNTVCSPAMLPRRFTDEYYRDVVSLGEAMARQGNVDIMLTAIVELSEMAEPNRAERIASILSSAANQRVYLVLHDNLSPRSQRADVQAISGAMRLIRLLARADIKVLVPFSGIDMVLWKYAGAQHVATGKFFNLRRFVPGRWDDPVDGGRVLPYWTDCERLTWLREDDLRLLDVADIINREAVRVNPFAVQILENLESQNPVAWVGLGWRQYLHWFMTIERQLDEDPQKARELLRQADGSWGDIEKAGLLMFDRENDGKWVRAWINALAVLT